MSFCPHHIGQKYHMAQPNCIGAGQCGRTDGIFSEPVVFAIGSHCPKGNPPVWLHAFIGKYSSCPKVPWVNVLHFTKCLHDSCLKRETKNGGGGVRGRDLPKIQTVNDSVTVLRNYTWPMCTAWMATNLLFSLY